MERDPSDLRGEMQLPDQCILDESAQLDALLPIAGIALSHLYGDKDRANRYPAQQHHARL